MPVEKSSPSRTASENAVRRSAPLISSAIEISVFQMTVSVMGSICRLRSSDIAAPWIDLDEEMAKLIHACAIAWQDDARRFALLDETRPLECLAGPHPVAVDDRGADHAPKLGEIGLALAANGRPGGGEACLAAAYQQPTLARRPERRDDIPIGCLDLRIGVHESVFLPVHLVERRAHFFLVIVVHRPIRQRDADIIALPRIPHVSATRDRKPVPEVELRHLPPRALLQLVEEDRYLASCAATKLDDAGGAGIDLVLRGEKPDGRAHSGREGHNDFGNAKRPRQPAGMHRPRPPERDQHMLAWIAAALDRDHPHGPLHIAVGNGVYAPGGGGERQP